MRPILLALGLGLALVSVPLPSASADHMGPCTHQWVELGFFVYDGLKQGGVKGAGSNAHQGATYCIRTTTDWLGIDFQLP